MHCSSSSACWVTGRPIGGLDLAHFSLGLRGQEHGRDTPSEVPNSRSSSCERSCVSCPREKRCVDKTRDKDELKMRYPQSCCVTCHNIKVGKTPSHSAEIALLSPPLSLSLVPLEPCVLFLPCREALCAGGSSAHGL